MTANESVMFCNQCEQTAHGTGCEKVGVCGKSPDVSALQDLLVNACAASRSSRSMPRLSAWTPRLPVPLSPTRCSPRSPTSTSTPIPSPGWSTTRWRYASRSRPPFALPGVRPSTTTCSPLRACRVDRRPHRAGPRVRLAVGHEPRRRRAVAAGDDAVRHEGRRRLRAPRPRTRVTRTRSSTATSSRRLPP